MARSKLENANGVRIGTWTPTTNSTKTISDYNCTYFRIGHLVIVSVLLWISGSDSNTGSWEISLPFTNIINRIYGVVGYFTNSAGYPNLHVTSANGWKYFHLEYGTSTNVTDIKRSQAGTMQCSLVYWTNDP